MSGKHKTIGVIGGLGPEATLDFFAKVIARTPAKTDQDHLHLVINNNPKVPNRNEAVAGTGPSAGPALAETAKALERAGADVLVMVCNAAHAFQQAIEDAVSIPFISMVTEVVTATLRLHPEVKTLGLLAASGCLDSGLYQKAFAKENIATLSLDDGARESFMQLLYKIKAGHKEQARLEMRVLAQSLIDEGAELIIAACTELPLVLCASDLSVALLNSTDVLVEAVFRYAEVEPLSLPA